MKIRILKNCRWATLPHEPILSFAANQIVDIKDSLANRLIETGFGESICDCDKDCECKQDKEKMHVQDGLQNKMMDHNNIKNKESHKKRGRPPKNQ